MECQIALRYISSSAILNPFLRQRRMKQYWSEGELVEFWTLTGVERQLSDQRTQRGRLGLAVLLKFFQFEGRFPDYHKAVPLPAVDDVAEQLDVPVSTGVCVAME